MLPQMTGVRSSSESMHHICFINSSAHEQLDHLSFLPARNRAAANTSVQVSLGHAAVISFGVHPVTESCITLQFCFELFWGPLFHHGCTNLCSFQQSTQHSTSSPALVIISLFDRDHSKRVWDISFYLTIFKSDLAVQCTLFRRRRKKETGPSNMNHLSEAQGIKIPKKDANRSRITQPVIS